MINIVIIEDESIAARNLQRLLSELEFNINVVSQIDSVKTAIKLLPNLQFDLILMDIHLSDGSAFQIFESIKIFKPIIFTTAFEEYALSAFKQNSIDYLLKPINKKDLTGAIVKYMSLFSDNGYENKINYGELKNLLREKKSYKKRFLVQIGKKLLSINTSSVAYFFVENKTTYIKTFENKSYILDNSLTQLESIVDPDIFFRINRQFLVSRQSINEVYYHSTSRLKVNLSPSFKEEIVWLSADRIVKFKKWLDK